jgi:CspA family cold shock protein
MTYDEGIVREWHEAEGWGVIDGPTVPGGCWAHFSAIEMPGYRVLSAGQQVTFVREAVEQDGFAYRAESVRPN